MSTTPPRSSYQSANGGDKTPELTTKRLIDIVVKTTATTTVTEVIGGTGTGTERGDTATDAVTKLKRNVGNATVDVRRRPRKNVRRGIDEEGSVN